MVLKVREEYGYKGIKNFMEKEKLKINKINQKDKWIFRDNPILDIFDEVDALMTSKKSFVYAIGNC